MSKVQKVFERIQKSKKEKKDIMAMYRDALSNSKKYQDALEELKVLKDTKKKIEESIKDEFRSEFSKLDTIKLDMENDNLLLSDAAITQLMDGETVEVSDEKENKYEPIFSVRFKRI